MRNFVALAVTLLTMTMLASGPASAAAPQNSDQATASTSAQDRKAQRTLANRNAAAKKLKAELDKQNSAKSNKTK